MDRIAAPLENVLLGLRAEHGQVVRLEQIARPGHRDAWKLTQAVTERGEVGAFGVSEQGAGKVDMAFHRNFIADWSEKWKARDQ